MNAKDFQGMRHFLNKVADHLKPAIFKVLTFLYCTYNAVLNIGKICRKLGKRFVGFKVKIVEQEGFNSANLYFIK